ncbi:transmembrane protein, putative [Bodo saltans]|uniref:Transmembrane protein, putative n=1 Tax=Bodo saltans TaxID=75058 RepID=A0A0S4JWR7_BODSA|nr:transmembrane protein, putative [Bodo saltans]|eukprot:CUG93584.1 transmembrane protein, putative [Bodo saltans]
MYVDDAPEIFFPALQEVPANPQRPAAELPPATNATHQQQRPHQRRQRHRLRTAQEINVPAHHAIVERSNNMAPATATLTTMLAPPGWQQSERDRTLVGPLFGPLRGGGARNQQQLQNALHLEEPKVASFRWKHEVFAKPTTSDNNNFSDEELIFETTTAAAADRRKTHRRHRRPRSISCSRKKFDQDDDNDSDEEHENCCRSAPVNCFGHRRWFPTFWFPHASTFHYRVVEIEFAYYFSSHKRVGLVCCSIAALLTIAGVFSVSGDRRGFPDTQDKLNIAATVLWCLCAAAMGLLGLWGHHQERECRDLSRGNTIGSNNNNNNNSATAHYDVKKLLRRLWILSLDPLSPRQKLRYYARLYEAVAILTHLTCYVFGAGNFLYGCSDSFLGIIEMSNRNKTALCNYSSAIIAPTTMPQQVGNCTTPAILPLFDTCAEYAQAYGPHLACRTSTQGAALLLLSTSSIIFFVPLRSIRLVPLHTVGVILLMLTFPVPGEYLPTGVTVHQFICLAMAWVVQIAIALGASIARELRSRATFRLHVERHRRSAQMIYLKYQLDCVAKIQLPEELLASPAAAVQSPPAANADALQFAIATPQGTGNSIAGFAPSSTHLHAQLQSNPHDPLLASFTPTEQSRGFSMLLPVGTATNPLLPTAGSKQQQQRRDIDDGIDEGTSAAASDSANTTMKRSALTSQLVMGPVIAPPLTTPPTNGVGAPAGGANIHQPSAHNIADHPSVVTTTTTTTGTVRHDSHAVLLHIRVLGFAGWGCRSSPSDYVDGVRRLMDVVDRILDGAHTLYTFNNNGAAAATTRQHHHHRSLLPPTQQPPPAAAFYLRRVHCFGDDICIIGVPLIAHTSEAATTTHHQSSITSVRRSPQQPVVVSRTLSSTVGAGGGGLSTSSSTRRADNNIQASPFSSPAAQQHHAALLLLRQAIVHTAHAIVSAVSACGRSSIEEFISGLPWAVEISERDHIENATTIATLTSPRAARRRDEQKGIPPPPLRLFPIAVIVEGGAGYKLHPATKNIVAIGPALDRAIALTLLRQQRLDQNLRVDDDAKKHLNSPMNSHYPVAAMDVEGPEGLTMLVKGLELQTNHETAENDPADAVNEMFGEGRDADSSLSTAATRNFAVALHRDYCKPTSVVLRTIPPMWPTPKRQMPARRVESCYITCMASTVAAPHHPQRSTAATVEAEGVSGTGRSDAAQARTSLGESQRSMNKPDDRSNHNNVSKQQQQMHQLPPMMLAMAMATSGAGALPSRIMLQQNLRSPTTDNVKNSSVPSPQQTTNDNESSSPTMLRDGRDCFVVTVHPPQPLPEAAIGPQELQRPAGGGTSGARSRRGSVSFAAPTTAAGAANVAATTAEIMDRQRQSNGGSPLEVVDYPLTPLQPSKGLHANREREESIASAATNATSSLPIVVVRDDARQRASRRVRMTLRYFIFHVFEDPATERNYLENCAEVGASPLDIMVCACGTGASVFMMMLIAVLDFVAERRSCTLAIDFIRHHPGGDIGVTEPEKTWKETTGWLWPTIAVLFCAAAVALHVVNVLNPSAAPTSPKSNSKEVEKAPKITEGEANGSCVQSRLFWRKELRMQLMLLFPKLFFTLTIYFSIPASVIHDALTLWIIMSIDFALIRPVAALGALGGIARDLPWCVPLIIRTMARHGNEDYINTPAAAVSLARPLVEQAIISAEENAVGTLSGRPSGTATYLAWASLLIIIAIRFLTEIRQREVFATAKLLDFQKEEMERDYKALELALDATVPAGGVAERLVRRMRSSKIFLDDWRRQDDNENSDDDDNADAPKGVQSSGEFSSSSAIGRKHIGGATGGIFSDNGSFGDNELATQTPLPPAPAPGASSNSAQLVPAAGVSPPAGGVLMHPLWSASGNAHSDDVPIIVLRWMAPPYHNSNSSANIESASSASPLPLSAFDDVVAAAQKNSEDEGILTDSFASARDRTHPPGSGKRRAVPAGYGGTLGGSDPWESIFDDITEAIPAHLKSAVQLIQCTRRVAIFAVPEGEESNSAGEGDGTQEADRDADNIRCLKALHAARAIAAYYSTRLAKHNHHNEGSYATTAVSAAVSNSAATPGGTAFSAKTRPRSDGEDVNDFLHQEPEDPFSDFEEVARGGYVGAAEPHTTPKRRVTVAVRPQQQHSPPPQLPLPSTTQAATGPALSSKQPQQSSSSQLSIWLDFGPAMGALIGRTKGIQFGYYGAPVTSLCAIQEQFTWHSNGAPDWRAFPGVHHGSSSSGESGCIVATQRFVETAQLRDISGEVLDMNPQSHLYGGVNATVAQQQPTLPYSLCLRVPASAARGAPPAGGGTLVETGRPQSFFGVPKQRFYCVSSLRTDEEEITSARKKI